MRNSRRHWAFLLLMAVLAVLGFEFFSLLPHTLAQTPTPEPTPTLVPVLDPIEWASRGVYTISLQVEQNAEFALVGFYQSADNAAALATVESQLDAVSDTLAALAATDPDPVVVTDTLPSGNQMAVRREFSYGEITAALALIALFLLQVVRFIWDASRPQKD